MAQHARLQVIGPVTLFAGLLAADGAAYALALYPSSQTLWSLNLQLFSVFRKGHYVLSSNFDIAYFQIVFIGLPLLLTACYGLVFNRRLALAIASSLSFIYVAFLLCAWYVYDQPSHQTSFFVTAIPSGPDVCFTGGLLGASLLSFIVSHMSYLRACKADGNSVKLRSFVARFDRDRRRPVLRGPH